MKRFLFVLSLLFVCMLGTSSATIVWDNDNFIDSTFWSQGPTDEDIINALYGFAWDTDTAYTKEWTEKCNPSDISVVRGNTLPSTLDNNTIYVLGTAKVIIDEAIHPTKCSAIISSEADWTTIYSSVHITHPTQVVWMINVDDTSAVNRTNGDYELLSNDWEYDKLILDNLHFNGTYDWVWNGEIHMHDRNVWIFMYWVFNVTLNNVDLHSSIHGISIRNVNNIVFNDVASHHNQSLWIDLWTISNSKFDNLTAYVNGAPATMSDWIILQNVNNSRFSNILCYNNKRDDDNWDWLHITQSHDNVFENVEIIDSVKWIYAYMSHDNTFRNLIIRNNDKWIMLDTPQNSSYYSSYTKNNIIENAYVYNNVTWIYMVDAAQNYINNASIFNNTNCGIHMWWHETSWPWAHPFLNIDNSINNTQIFNNNYWVYLQWWGSTSEHPNIFNNVLIYSNNYWYYSENYFKNILNDVWIYNNNYGLYLKDAQFSPYYYWTFKLFYNTNNQWDAVTWSNSQLFDDWNLVDDVPDLLWDLITNPNGDLWYLLDWTTNPIIEFRWPRTKVWDIQNYSYWIDIPIQKQWYCSDDWTISICWTYDWTKYIWSNVKKVDVDMYASQWKVYMQSDDNSITNYSVFWSYEPVLNVTIWTTTNMPTSHPAIIWQVWWNNYFATHFETNELDSWATWCIIEYSTTEITSWNVTATLTWCSIPVNITNNDWSNEYIFTNTWTFIFEYEDVIWFTWESIAEVDWIDKTSPSCIVEYSIETLTSWDVVATLTWCNKNITVTNNNGSTEYTFTNTWIFTFEFEDWLWNTGSTIAEVTWIDKINPVCNITLNPNTVTSWNIVATLNCDETVVVTNNNWSTGYTFTNTWTFTFEYEDLVWNAWTTWITITDSMIDRVAPICQVEYNPGSGTTTQWNVIATLTWCSENIVTTETSHTFTANDSYVFNFTDVAGNPWTVTATVSWIKKWNWGDRKSVV